VAAHRPTGLNFVARDYHLLIVGASARSAAASALRAGLRPWCLDLFADADLLRIAPARTFPPGGYPRALAGLLPLGPPGPWLYTGGLENHPRLIGRLARARPLWGNSGAALAAARSPFRAARLLSEAGLPVPDVRREPPYDGRDWLSKPQAGAGGAGIRPVAALPPGPPPQGRREGSRHYFQRFIPGEPWSAVYCATDGSSRLLGVTRQLVGEPWLHAAQFRYCGSVGPLDPPAPLRDSVGRVGEVLTAGCHLRGLFGVDGVVDAGGTFWPVEVNPRYTASVEVLEHARGVPALAQHRAAFDRLAPPPGPAAARAGVVGKAVLYARETLTVPAGGPWEDVLRRPPGVHELPDFADIPPAGQRIEAGRPVLSFFARAATVEGCLEALRAIAQSLDRRLFGR
jgi:predicted ATP-grasp superfamily ATP-dependent carboligase